VSDALDATIELLTSLGHRVEESHPAPFGDPKATAHFITAYSVWVRRELDQLAELTGQPLTEDGFEAGTWATAEAGNLVPGAQYLAALEGLHEVTRDAIAWWEVDGFDLLLSPTIPELPPTLGQFAPTPDNPLNGLFRSAITAGFAAPLNITGQPAISVPLHQSPSGLPIGMQFVGAPARDDLLIRIASQLEAALPWADRRPPVWAGQA
jgi:amidase